MLPLLGSLPKRNRPTGPGFRLGWFNGPIYPHRLSILLMHRFKKEVNKSDTLKNILKNRVISAIMSQRQVAYRDQRQPLLLGEEESFVSYDDDDLAAASRLRQKRAR